MRLISELLGRGRQLLFPRAFRILQPEKDARLLDDIAALAQVLGSAADSAVPLADNSQLGDDLLAKVGTGLWRLRARMIDPATAQPKEEMRRAYRHLESVWDTLREYGVEIHDHDGEPFDSGKALVVLAYEQDAAVTGEIVRETIKPTIYLRERSIQRGEVIVASPDAR